MSVRAFGRMALLCGLTLVFAGGQQVAQSHEAASPPPKPELLPGDEPSDAMETGTTTMVPKHSCAADNTPLRMPFTERGQPDEAP